MLSSADESIHGLAVEIPTNHREIPGSTPGKYNLQIEITSFSNTKSVAKSKPKKERKKVEVST